VRDGRLDAAGRSHPGEESASESAPPSIDFPFFAEIKCKRPEVFQRVNTTI